MCLSSNHSKKKLITIENLQKIEYSMQNLPNCIKHKNIKPLTLTPILPKKKQQRMRIQKCDIKITKKFHKFGINKVCSSHQERSTATSCPQTRKK